DVTADAGRFDLALRAFRAHIARDRLENQSGAARHADFVPRVSDVVVVPSAPALIVHAQRDSRRVRAEPKVSVLDRRRDFDIGTIPAGDANPSGYDGEIDGPATIEPHGSVYLRCSALVLPPGGDRSRNQTSDDECRELHFVFHFQVLAGSNAAVRRSSTFLSCAIIRCPPRSRLAGSFARASRLEVMAA